MPAIRSFVPPTVFKRVVSVKSPNISPSKMNRGKCSSAGSFDTCASTDFLETERACGVSNCIGDGTSSSTIFHVPGLPSPATEFRNPGGVCPSLISLKSNLFSAAAADNANRNPHHRKQLRIARRLADPGKNAKLREVRNPEPQVSRFRECRTKICFCVHLYPFRG